MDRQLHEYAKNIFHKNNDYPNEAMTEFCARLVCGDDDFETHRHDETIYIASKPSSRYLSILFYNFLHGGTKPSWDYEAFIYDLDTGASLTWADVLGGSKFDIPLSERGGYINPESFSEDYEQNYSEIYEKYGDRYGDLRVLVEGCPFVLTPEGISSVCGPYSSSRVTRGLHNSDVVYLPKEEAVKMGISPKFWE